MNLKRCAIKKEQHYPPQPVSLGTVLLSLVPVVSVVYMRAACAECASTIRLRLLMKCGESRLKAYAFPSSLKPTEPPPVWARTDSTRP